MSKKVAIVLSGCGGLDGAEVQEAVCSILAIEERGFFWEAFSLNRDQEKVISSITMKELDQKRNMMEEAGRITHGKISDITKLNEKDFDILWFPGGYGVVSSFSDIAMKGADGEVREEIKTVIKRFFKVGKPIAALCIAPSIVAKTLEDHQLTLTLGTSDEYSEILRKLGHNPKKISSGEYIYDSKNNLYTSPAYMERDATCKKIYSACKKITERLANG